MPLCVGPGGLQEPCRILLLPGAADRVAGDLEVEPGDCGDPPSVFGEGLIEYSMNVPRKQAYRVYLRYASPVLRPCDLVINGRDLHPFHMAAQTVR